jgi:hypothetical protein
MRKEKRGHARGLTIAAGEAHTAECDTMGCDGTAGLVEKKKGQAAPRKKRTARCRDGGKSGGGFGSSSGGKGFKKIKQVIGNAT